MIFDVDTDMTLIRVNLNFIGPDSIGGKVKEGDIMVKSAIVKLFHNDVVISTVITNDFGEFLFEYINLQNFRYYIITHDPKKQRRGDIIDNIGKK